MSNLLFEVDELQLKEVESILDSIGLDINIAFSIFINKIIKEKGLPFSLKQSSNENKNEDELHILPKKTRRTNNAITIEMVEEVWSAFIKYNEGFHEFKDLTEYITKKSGMNQGSASIYLNILIKLSKGEISRRSMKTSDFEFFLKKFKYELGHQRYEKAIQSVEVSIPYWKSNIPTFANNMEDLLKKLGGM